eukprot:Skav234453  [mRNA]  locus=scaffold1647:102040:102804:+ [translate_table: standard]
MGAWTSYNGYRLDETAGFDFASKLDGAEDYASCTGRYVELVGQTLNEKPVFLNPDKRRMLAATGDAWVILSMDYLEEFLETQPASFGGFHGSCSCQPHHGWEHYLVTPIGRDFSTGKGWEKFQNTTVSCSAVSNSGVVRSDEDFEDMRRKCVESECGGFAWRKPHFNQFGEEDNPPVCFFYRRTQADLKEVHWVSKLGNSHSQFAHAANHPYTCGMTICKDTYTNLKDANTLPLIMPSLGTFVAHDARFGRVTS